MADSISFVPARIDGVHDVDSVTIYEDRLCLTLKNGEEITHSFKAMARNLRRKEQVWWKRIFPQRGYHYVGERDFCPGNRYFRWFTEPEITIFTPPDPLDYRYDDTWFYQIHEVMWKGRFRTWDLG